MEYPEPIAPDEGRRAGCDRHRQERPGADLRHQNLDGEHNAANRRIERRGNSRRRRSAEDMHRSCPILELNAEPIWMIGPSRPMVAPLPMAIADARDFTTATTGRMTPFP